MILIAMISCSNQSTNNLPSHQSKAVTDLCGKKYNNTTISCNHIATYEKGVVETLIFTSGYVSTSWSLPHIPDEKNQQTVKDGVCPSFKDMFGNDFVNRCSQIKTHVSLHNSESVSCSISWNTDLDLINIIKPYKQMVSKHNLVIESTLSLSTLISILQNTDINTVFIEKPFPEGNPPVPVECKNTSISEENAILRQAGHLGIGTRLSVTQSNTIYCIEYDAIKQNKECNMLPSYKKGFLSSGAFITDIPVSVDGYTISVNKNLSYKINSAPIVGLGIEEQLTNDLNHQINADLNIDILCQSTYRINLKRIYEKESNFIGKLCP